MKIFDKRINRLDRLSKHRQIRELTTEWHIWTFEIEISPKALAKLKSMDKRICFSLEHDFWIMQWTKEAYRIRIGNEHKDIKTDFSYNIIWYIRAIQHSSLNNRWVQVVLEHIDVSTKRWIIRNAVYILAEEIDKRYWNDCWWENYWNWQIDLIKNKKPLLPTP